MVYGDLSSIVQLGVGLHLGAALLQMYGELGIQPLSRTLSRIRSLFDEKNLEKDPKKGPDMLDELAALEGGFELFKIRYSNDYAWHMKLNSAFAFFILVLLVVIAFKAECTISTSLAILIVTVSIVPAPVSVATLLFKVSRNIQTIKGRADRFLKKIESP